MSVTAETQVQTGNQGGQRKEKKAQAVQEKQKSKVKEPKTVDVEFPKRSADAEIEIVDFDKGIISTQVSVFQGTKQTGQMFLTSGWLAVGPATKITINGKDSGLADLQTAHPISAKVAYNYESAVEKINGYLIGKALWIDVVGEMIDDVILAVDPKTLTILTSHRDKDNSTTTQKIKDSVKVVIDGKKADFTDLKPKMPVILQVSKSDKKLVTGIIALGPNVELQIKAVDADKNTLSVSLPKFHLTADGIVVAKDAKVILNGKEAKLSDLKAGMLATLQMSADPERNLVVGITAEKTEEKK